mmetsp:Transcript_5070/g.11284  ORF Transcript_5070/g.11284 Transcript_5070/m.11284 type:complete len:179 (-) Transcript_5070:42-578(-)
MPIPQLLSEIAMTWPVPWRLLHPSATKVSSWPSNSMPYWLASTTSMRPAMPMSVLHPRPGQIPDNISALTDILGQFAALSTATSPTTSSTLRSTPSSTCRRNRDPTKFLANGGQGKIYSSYCWKYGCNCTHWTRKCDHLTQAEKTKYCDANFDNCMEASTKFLDWCGCYKKEFSDDSL